MPFFVTLAHNFLNYNLNNCNASSINSSSRKYKATYTTSATMLYRFNWGELIYFGCRSVCAARPIRGGLYTDAEDECLLHLGNIRAVKWKFPSKYFRFARVIATEPSDFRFIDLMASYASYMVSNLLNADLSHLILLFLWVCKFWTQSLKFWSKCILYDRKWVPVLSSKELYEAVII